MELFGLTFAAGWASGINAYATVFLLGLLGRFAGLADVPDGFQRVDVLVVMGVLGLLELVADKIPYLDSVWDTISTIIRPIAGALIGGLIAGQSGDLATITLASVGGVTALLSHITKAGTRLAINTSPEPVSNVGHSLGGDISLLTVLGIAALNPVAAAVVAGILLLATGIVFFWLFAKVRQGYRALRKRLQPAASPEVG
ncbi:DUF4126 domain-containing protein [Aestuariimicrobium sp. Y1814]|uniref:DUF4126 domain-containing protein n=1 Tax=Aestuariimicrobium sp. Y1814 TaxID=3418742 RepID=UPI003DA737B7